MKKTLFLLIVAITLLISMTSCDTISGIIGKDNSDTDVVACSHEWVEATCQDPSTCTKCGETKGGISGHKYSEATCEAAPACLTCGIWYGRPLGHDFAAANCEVGKVCRICGVESGQPAHNYIEATCTEAKTCSKCGETSGKPLGHQLSTELIAATCTADGYEKLSCSVCDYTGIGEVFPMEAHANLSYVYNNDATALTDGTATLACPHCDYSVTKTLVGSANIIAEAFAGKKISILGDSISTYTDISSGVAADTTNSTIRNNIVWYGYNPSQPTFGGYSVDSTWWQTVINAMGASLLVNNSNAGESVYQSVNDRCMQLHDDTGENAGETPDIIFVYLGTNDNNRTMGSLASLSMVDIQRRGDDPNYNPVTLAEAYAVMIYRIQKTYPDAEIFCLTNLERSDMAAEYTLAVSKVIREVVAFFDGVHLADIGAYTGITLDNPDYLTYMPKDQGGKSIHPGTEGMKEIARVVMESVLANSKYLIEDFFELMPENEGKSDTDIP